MPLPATPDSLQLMGCRSTGFHESVYPLRGVHRFHIIRTPHGWTTEWSSVPGACWDEQEAWLEATGVVGTWFPRLKDLLEVLQAANLQEPLPLDLSLDTTIKLRATPQGHLFASTWVDAQVVRIATQGCKNWIVTLTVRDPAPYGKPPKGHAFPVPHLHEARQIIQHFVRMAEVDAA
jgi:hypothetical protein